MNKLPLLSIEAAEELQRFSLKKNTNLKHTKELSDLIKKSAWRWDYIEIFSKAYSSAYSIDISKLNFKNSKPYMMDTAEKLESPLDLREEEIEKLIRFCVNLSDYSALHEEDIRKWRTPSNPSMF